MLKELKTQELMSSLGKQYKNFEGAAKALHLQ
jgi:hypothetical protein